MMYSNTCYLTCTSFHSILVKELNNLCIIHWDGWDTYSVLAGFCVVSIQRNFDRNSSRIWVYLEVGASGVQGIDHLVVWGLKCRENIHILYLDHQLINQIEFNIDYWYAMKLENKCTWESASVAVTCRMLTPRGWVSRTFPEKLGCVQVGAKKFLRTVT